MKAYVRFEKFTIMLLLKSKSILMDVPEKYQSTDNLECPLAEGTLWIWNDG